MYHYEIENVGWHKQQSNIIIMRGTSEVDWTEDKQQSVKDINGNSSVHKAMLTNSSSL